jgi:predicted nuclease of predicted toxin-antitoxin system
VRPREPFVFLVDRCLGRAALQALRAATEANEVALHLDDHYPQDEADEVWIPGIGARGWIILTKDKEIQRRPNEQAALISAHTAVFVLVKGGLTTAKIGEALTRALPAMRKATRRYQPPLLGRIGADGAVTVAWASGERFVPPKPVKVPKPGFRKE